MPTPNHLWRDDDGDTWEQIGPDEWQLYSVQGALVEDSAGRFTRAEIEDDCGQLTPAHTARALTALRRFLLVVLAVAVFVACYFPGLILVLLP